MLFQRGKIRGLEQLDLCGFHMYSGTQCLNADAIAENYAIFMEIFRRVCSRHGVEPERLIFGSGMGIPYYDSDTAVDAALVGEKINAAVDAFKREPAFANTVSRSAASSTRRITRAEGHSGLLPAPYESGART